jgi:hypothetical protein
MVVLQEQLVTWKIFTIEHGMIPALMEIRQEDSEFEALLGYSNILSQEKKKSNYKYCVKNKI